MASIFSFAEPTRVSSPWLSPQEPGKSLPNNTEKSREALQPQLLEEYGITKLDPEPQEGPVEYKLHLLLPGKDDRKFTFYSTSNKRIQSTNSASNMTRQGRLEHLSTQLLWRLKQASPYHATSSRQDTKPPMLPEAIMDSGQVAKPDKLPIGLEDSQGALYEIGVHDSGTLVGIPMDEMDQSLLVLTNMAASLGCDVKVLRVIEVGFCGYEERGKKHVVKLYVSEALVTPDLALSKDGPLRGQSTTPQLRVTLTGPTTAGKSTLLGTLSTGTLDNGEGSSRLSLLRHRHEVASGVTSSVAQELIGYKDRGIFNFGRDNVESWIDIHDGAEDGRLVFVSDSAGATRYRRTILRGLVGWAPHWVILCIAADDKEFSSGINGLGLMSGPSLDAAAEHLDLCLKLGVPLAIAITKCDVASQETFKATIQRARSTVEASGRKPMLVPGDRTPHANILEVPRRDNETLEKVMKLMGSGPLSYVPILFTSAVKGIGIGLMHALLANMPMPPPPTSQDLTGPVLNPEQPMSLFHIDEKYNLPARNNPVTSSGNQPTHEGTVVSGYIRFGSLEVGTRVVVGPFPPQEDDTQEQPPEERPSPGPGGYALAISHPSSTELTRIAARNAISASKIQGEWHNGRIASVRNLRLPVQCLAAGQVGTLGIILDAPENMSRIRKGMVVAIPSRHMEKTEVSLQAASGLTARFTSKKAVSLVVGNVVSIYVASVRTAAKVTQVSEAYWEPGGSGTATNDIEDVFNLDDQMRSLELDDGTKKAHGVEVTLDILTSREWIEMGSQVLVLDGSRAGLEALVGKVVEIVD